MMKWEKTLLDINASVNVDIDMKGKYVEEGIKFTLNCNLKDNCYKIIDCCYMILNS